MRNVERVPKPACLVKNGRRWKREYLQALRGRDTSLIKRRRGRYNHPKVRSELDRMYRNLCCYCESPVGPVRADQIEHRMPVEHFRERTFEWDNLHLGCGGCNRAKTNKWDATNPILDAVTDVPIAAHLDYEPMPTGVRRTWLTPRGATTVSHADLNREGLRQARTATLMGVLNVINEIRMREAKDQTDLLAANRRAGLKEMYVGHYGSMIRWAVDCFLGER